MPKIKPGNFVVIQSFMVNDLKLKGNELIIYAVIYGFSQDSQKFTGSIQYLSEWCNCSRHTVIDNLKTLCEKNLIEKYEVERNGVKFCEYQCRNLPPSANSSLPSAVSSLGGSAKTAPNNISSNNIFIDKIEDSIGAKPRFTPPSLQDVKDYCLEIQSPIMPEAFIDYYTANGWMVGKSKMKDWKAAVRTWTRKEQPNKKTETAEDRWGNIGVML